MTTDGQPERQEPGERRRRSVAEWATFAVSGVLILAIVGLVTYLAVSGTKSPPVIAAAPLTDEIRREAGSYYLPIEVTNRGGQTAEAVLVRGELTAAGTPETAEFTIDFLANGETAEGTFVFATDPLAGDLTVDVVSFQPP